MGRLALRPALRAYAHAPAAAADEELVNTLSVYLDGVEDSLYHYDAGGAGLPDSSAGYTVAGWVKWVGPYNGTYPYPFLVNRQNDGSGAWHYDNTITFMSNSVLSSIYTYGKVYTSSAYDKADSNTGHFDDDTTWVFVCGRAAPSDNIYMNIDGADDDSEPTGTVYSTGSFSNTSKAMFTFGSQLYDSLYVMKCKLNNWTVWERCLSLVEVQTLRNGGTPADPTTLGLGNPFAWYKFGNGAAVGADEMGNMDLSSNGDPTTVSDVPPT